MGQGDQKRSNLYAGKIGDQWENPPQNGSTFSQATGTSPAFFVPSLVLQNLFSVSKLPNLFQDFLLFLFLGVGCNFFAHVTHLSFWKCP